MLKPKAFDHVGLFVTNLDESLKFYTKGLGLELLRRRGAGREGSAVLGVGNAEFNVFHNPASIGSGAPQRVDHLCLVMDYATIDDLIMALRDAEIPVANSPVKRSDGMALFVHDPDGLRVELLVKD